MEERKLYRSRDDRMVAGVCGGIAEYFALDSSIVRLLAVILAVIGNAAVAIVYLVLWIVLPEEPAEEAARHAQPEINVPVAAATAGPEYAAYAVDATTSPSAPLTPEPAPPQPPLQTPQQPPVHPHAPYQPPSAEHHGVRSGLIWLGVALIVLGGALLVDRVFPDLSLWGFWPGTLIGIIFIVTGIRTMVTKGGDD